MDPPLFALMRNMVIFAAVAAGLVSTAQAQTLPADDAAWAHVILKDALEGARFPLSVERGYLAGSSGTNFYSGVGCNSTVTENYPPTASKAAETRTVNIDWRKVRVERAAEFNGYWRFTSSDWSSAEAFFTDKQFSPPFAAIRKLHELCNPTRIEVITPQMTRSQNALKSAFQSVAIPLQTLGAPGGPRGSYRVMGTGCSTFIWTAIPEVTRDGKLYPASSTWFFAQWMQTKVGIQPENPNFIFLGNNQTPLHLGTADNARRVKAEVDQLTLSCRAKPAGGAATPTQGELAEANAIERHWPTVWSTNVPISNRPLLKCISIEFGDWGEYLFNNCSFPIKLDVKVGDQSIRGCSEAATINAVIGAKRGSDWENEDEDYEIECFVSVSAIGVSRDLK